MIERDEEHDRTFFLVVGEVGTGENSNKVIDVFILNDLDDLLFGFADGR